MFAGDIIQLPVGWSMVRPSFDVETYSEAGYYWDAAGNRWRGATKNKGGLPVVGAAAYAGHPTARLLSLSYDLKDGRGPILWAPVLGPPLDLFNHIEKGGVLSAFNADFEWYFWYYVCHKKYGWPELPYTQLYCDQAKAAANGYPLNLKDCAKVTGAKEQKDPAGEKLIRKLTVPRSPTKNDPRLYYSPQDAPTDFRKLYAYNIQDVKAEDAVSAIIPDLTPFEQNLYFLDKKINLHGCPIDMESLRACLVIVKQCQDIYNRELYEITDEAVKSADELEKLKTWLKSRGVEVDSLDKDHVAEFMDRKGEIPDDCYRAIEIRSILGSKSVAKVFALERMIAPDDTMKGMFQLFGALRTKRYAGRGPQPQNLPKKGPFKKWGPEQIEEALADIKTHDLAWLIDKYKDPIKLVCGCLRGLFCASEGHDLICSDYSAIEAVVLAFMAGEQWRIDVFNTHGKIYEMSASKATGVPFEEIINHKKIHKTHHPLRNGLGKTRELAGGYQGAYGAWCKFGAEEFMTEPEIIADVKKWRKESPNVVNFWYDIERTAKKAIANPGTPCTHRGITYIVQGGKLYCYLPDGEFILYHNPRLVPYLDRWGKTRQKIVYSGWNSDYKKGPKGWMDVIETYGGKLVENIIQAIAGNILKYAMLNVDKVGYQIVLHVHDEIVAMVKKGWGSVAELERLMNILPPAYASWPVKAKGGWRGPRFRKDG